MKNGKNPTVRQMKFLEKWGKKPEDWKVVKDTPTEMVIVSRYSDKMVLTIPKE